MKDAIPKTRFDELMKTAQMAFAQGDAVYEFARDADTVRRLEFAMTAVLKKLGFYFLPPPPNAPSVVVRIRSKADHRVLVTTRLNNWSPEAEAFNFNPETEYYTVEVLR